MANLEITITELTSICREVLEDAYLQMRNRASWDLNCPVVVVDARHQPPRQVQIGVGGVGGVVPVSTAIENPLIREWLEISAEVAQPQEAMDEMLSRYASDFSDAYADFQDEKIRKGGCLIGSDDLAAFVNQSRTAYPEKIAVLAVLPGAEEHQWSVIPFSWTPA
ncbi:hypothetical protein [Parasynechococcus sp.]|jgi:hypothetical protein|uniref:hypothetical protein n=1 Tax=Parasynechococcus sp. TaxID=3101203 RepID=UPI00370395C0